MKVIGYESMLNFQFGVEMCSAWIRVGKFLWTIGIYYK